MIGKMICLGLLSAASVSALGQEVRTAATGDKAVWPHMHQCTVVPGDDWVPASDAPPIPSVGVVVKKNVHRTAASAPGSRIDLRFAASPSAGGGVPTISAYAINTKGTGTSAGRSAGGASATVACVSRDMTRDNADQKASDIFLQMPPDARALGWSCSVTGTDEAPQFVLTLLVPTILGQAERGSVAPAGRSEWSWGVSNGGHRVSIVPHGATVTGASSIACASASSKVSGGGYDLAMQKK